LPEFAVEYAQVLHEGLRASDPSNFPLAWDSLPESQREIMRHYAFAVANEGSAQAPILSPLA
jgi:hypothetical protein